MKLFSLNRMLKTMAGYFNRKSSTVSYPKHGHHSLPQELQNEYIHAAELKRERKLKRIDGWYNG